MRSPAVIVSALLLFSIAHCPGEAQTASTPLTVERIYAHGPLIGTLPEGISWSSDGKHLTYLDGGELIDLDPESGKPHVLVSRAKLTSLSGADGTEQDRDHRQRYGMASYIWAPDSKHLLFDANGRLWLYDQLHSRAARVVIRAVVRSGAGNCILCGPGTCGGCPATTCRRSYRDISSY